MPIYEYRCKSCNSEYEFLFKSYPKPKDIAKLECTKENCPGGLERKLSQVSFNTGKTPDKTEILLVEEIGTIYIPMRIGKPKSKIKKPSLN